MDRRTNLKDATWPKKRSPPPLPSSAPTKCDKLSPNKFYVAVGALYFLLASCLRLENRKFST